MSMKPYDPFTLILDHVAAPFPVEDALPFLQGHADRLGITVQATINGRRFIASPGESSVGEVAMSIDSAS